MKFRLATKTGDHVADVDVPPFQSNPDVLIWGDRVFSFHEAITTGGDPCSAEYRESFAFMVPVPLPEREGSPAFQKVTEPTPTKS